MDILKFYSELLESLDVVIKDGHFCTYSAAGVDLPLQIGEKRLVLPTRDILRDGNWQDRIAFHPLSENPTRTESAVLKKLKSLVQVKLSSSAILLMRELVRISVQKSIHAQLSPKAQRLLSNLPEADEKFADTFDKIVEAMTSGTHAQRQQQMVSIYLRKAGLYRGSSVLQLAVVSFPLALELGSSDGVVYGVKLRRKDQKMLASLLEYVFPNHNDTNEYSGPSDSMMAPRLDALLKAYVNVATMINKHVKTFRKVLEDPEAIEIDLDWAPMAQDLSVYRGQIPSLSGNEGELVDDEQTPSKRTVTVSEGRVVPRAAAEETPPWEEPKLSEPSKSSKFNLDGVRAALTQPTAPPPPPAMHHTPTPSARPSAASHGKADFHELMARRNASQTAMMPPHVAAPVMPYGAPMQQVPPQNMPTWAMSPSAPQPTALRPGDYAHRPNLRGAGQMPMQYGQPMGYPQPMQYGQPMGYPQAMQYGPPMGQV